jgi:hypothetical protein
MAEGLFERNPGERYAVLRMSVPPVDYPMRMAVFRLDPYMGKIICIVRVSGIGYRVDVTIVPAGKKIDAGMSKLHGIIILK